MRVVHFYDIIITKSPYSLIIKTNPFVQTVISCVYTCYDLTLINIRSVQRWGHNSKVLYQVSAFSCYSAYWQRPKLFKKLLFVDFLRREAWVYDLKFRKKISETIILWCVCQGKGDIALDKYPIQISNATCNFRNNICDFIFLFLKDGQAFFFNFHDFRFFPSNYRVYFFMPVIASFINCRC